MYQKKKKQINNLPNRKHQAQDSLVNATRYLRKKLYQLSTISGKETEKNLFILQGKAHITLTPKPEKCITRKFYTSISHEHRHNNSQQNISKPNPTMYKKKYIPQRSRIYLRYESWFSILKSVNILFHINRFT